MRIRYAASLFVICFVFGFSTKAISQVSCQETLNQAGAEFDAGRFYSLPTLLSNCLQSGFTQEQKFRAYYLLAQAYLVLNDPIAAEDTYLKLLTVDPEFRPNEKDDPIDLVYLSRKFTSRPRFTPHYRIGGSFSFPRTIYSVSTFPASGPTEVFPKFGFQLGAGLDWNINDNWSIGAEGNFATKSFLAVTNRIAVNDDLSVTDKSSWFDFPMYVKYSYDSGTWRPFAYAGVALNLLMSSTASSVFNDRTEGSSNIRSTNGQDENLLNKRNFLNRSILVGGGVKYKVGKNFVYADIRYMMGLNNLTIPEKNYYDANDELANSVTQDQFVNDFFRLDNVSISFGYVRPLYDPRKLRAINGKSFFRKIFRPRVKSK